jgi:hypothetical protein
MNTGKIEGCGGVGKVCGGVGKGSGGVGKVEKLVSY